MAFGQKAPSCDPLSEGRVTSGSAHRQVRQPIKGVLHPLLKTSMFCSLSQHY